MGDPFSTDRKKPMSPLWYLMRRLKRDASGATAVEFGMVALPFLTLIFALLEVSLVFFGTLLLDNAVEQSARLVRTGQAQAASMSVSDFKENVCQQIVSLFDCTNKLQVELVTFQDFQGASDYASNASNSPLDSDGELRSNFTYNSDSKAEDIVLLRVYFEWDLMLDFPGVGLSNMDNGKRLISATTAFKNEPFN